MKYDLLNINLILKNFEFSICTSEYWGNYKERADPLVEIELNGHIYQLPLSVFIKKIEPILKKVK